MSFAETLSTIILSAVPTQLDGLARDLWRAYSAGHLTDDQAQSAAEAIAAKRLAPRYLAGQNNGPAGFSVAHVRLPKHRNQRSPDKAASIARRRKLAASRPLPPDLASHFTTCELAALRIIFSEIQAHGSCAMFIDQIAALAGTCRTVVKTAKRKARDLGLILDRERRRAGHKSRTSIVTIINHQLRGWLRLPDKAGSSLGRSFSSLGDRGGHKSDRTHSRGP